MAQQLADSRALSDKQLDEDSKQREKNIEVQLALLSHAVSPSAFQPLSVSAPQRLSASASQPLSLSASQPLSLSAPQPLSLSAPQPLSASVPQPLLGFQVARQIEREKAHALTAQAPILEVLNTLETDGQSLC